MSPARLFSLLAVGLALSSLTLSGCSDKSGSLAEPVHNSTFQGQVIGGQQPVAGSTIQVYTVGTSGDGSAATPLLSQTVTTDANGNFSITGKYSCSSATYVYLTAAGGQPLAGQTNSNLALMTAAGTCTQLQATSFITINEVTTVAAVSALGPWMTGPQNVGSSTADVNDMESAFTLASELASTSTGFSPGPSVPTGTIVPNTEIYTLADILASCVNSAGGAAGSSTPCGSLFTLAANGSTTPTDTITAMVNIAHNPTGNVAALFNLASGTAPFPGLSSAPNDFYVSLQALTGGVGYLAITPGELNFGTIQTGFTSPSQSASVSNTGSGSASVSSYAVLGVNASDFSVYTPAGYSAGDLCDYGSVAPGETCTVSVTASPSAAGGRTAYLKVTSSAANSPQMIPLSAQGSSAYVNPLSLSPTSLSYDLAGPWQDITVSNLNAVPIKINSVQLSDSTDFSIVSNTCGSSLAAQSTCVLSVTSSYYAFTSSAPTQKFSTLTINTNAGANTTASISSNNVGYATGDSSEVSFHGSSAYYNVFGSAALGGPAASNYSLSPSQCIAQAFDPYGGNEQCSLTITRGSGTLTGAAYVYVAGGESYYPTPYREYFVVQAPSSSGSSSLPISGPASLVLSLTSGGSPDPQLAGTPSASFTIANNGSSTLNLTAGFIGTSSSEVSAALTGCSPLAAGSTCGGTVTLSDGAPLSTTVNLVVKDINASESFVIPVTLTRSYAAITANTASLSFGNQNAGTTSIAQTVMIGDQHGYPLNHPISAAITAGAPFAIQGGATCAASSSATCSISVAFTPTGAGASSGTLTLTDQTSGNSTTVSLSGTGVTGAPAVSISPSPLTFVARSVGSTSAALPVTVTNSGTGTATLNISAVTLTGATAYTQTSNCVGAVLAAGSSCTVQVTFAPTAPGASSGMLTIVSNAASSPDSITVSGSAN